MNVVRWICLLSAVGAAGCGGEGLARRATASDAGGMSEAGAPVRGFWGTPIPAIGDASASYDAGPHGLVTIDDAAAPDAAAAYSVTLTMTGFAVPPGGELYKCQDFADPFPSEPVDITRYELVMSPGSHHMLLFSTTGATDGPIIDCPQGGLQLGPSTFGAQSETAVATYPAGIGAAIPADTGFTMDAHYINSGSSPIQANVKVTMFVAPPGVVTQHVGGLGFILTSITIPPTGQPFTVSGSCSVPQDMNVLSTGAHMHRRATHFVASAGSTMLYQTDSWEDPPARAFSPPLFLKANTQIDWACTYVNDTGSPLTFGPSALTNVMCNFNAAFYPLQDPSNPSFTCLN